MLYTVSAQNARFVETALLHAFTAWETITNGVSSIEKADKILGARMFGRLRTELLVLIKSFVDREKVGAELVSDMESKLGELNRLSFAPRAADLLERYSVPWADLWSPGRDLLLCVRQVTKRRNDFVHRGDIGDLTLANIDAKRATVLVERLIYRLVGGEEGWLDPFAYAFVNDLPRLEAAIEAERSGSEPNT